MSLVGTLMSIQYNNQSELVVVCREYDNWDQVLVRFLNPHCNYNNTNDGELFGRNSDYVDINSLNDVDPELNQAFRRKHNAIKEEINDAYLHLNGDINLNEVFIRRLNRKINSQQVEDSDDDGDDDDDDDEKDFKKKKYNSNTILQTNMNEDDDDYKNAISRSLNQISGRSRKSRNMRLKNKRSKRY